MFFKDDTETMDLIVKLNERLYSKYGRKIKKLALKKSWTTNVPVGSVITPSGLVDITDES